MQKLTKALLTKLSHLVLQVDADVLLELCVELLSGFISLEAMPSDFSKLICDLPVLLEKTEICNQR